MGDQVEDWEDVGGYADGKVIQFHPREPSVKKPTRGKQAKTAEVIELTRERIESTVKRSQKTKAEERTSIPLPWFGCF